MSYTAIQLRILGILCIVLFSLSLHAQFITKWQTTTAGESITIPTTGGGYNYDVNWGDGNPVQRKRAMPHMPMPLQAPIR